MPKNFLNTFRHTCWTIIKPREETTIFRPPASEIIVFRNPFGVHLAQNKIILGAHNIKAWYCIDCDANLLCLVAWFECVVKLIQRAQCISPIDWENNLMKFMIAVISKLNDVNLPVSF